MAAMVFIRKTIENVETYMALTEADVEEEYRRAGKLHKYEPAKELDKRFARIIKKYPPPQGLFIPNLDRYLSSLDDDDDE
ncbi:hypothetical protein C2845_PM07G38110 [Panicum miliaceum]|uniref:Uncharacterized protein n=1 Tax=Panicum miliaceum TaxID=4540 RepID=A0A3L6SJB3_PANMI|nr:hypothetical protein C2845_PM07G38110 [Panicum miliaceum]